MVKEEKQRQIRVPLREERGKYTHIIGYYYPERSWVTTVNGNWSVDDKLSSDGKTRITGNKAHQKRMFAAYNSKDFTYREKDDLESEENDLGD